MILRWAPRTPSGRVAEGRSWLKTSLLAVRVAYSSPTLFGLGSRLEAPAVSPLRMGRASGSMQSCGRAVAQTQSTSTLFRMSALLGIERALSSTPKSTDWGCHQLSFVKLTGRPVGVETPPSTVVCSVTGTSPTRPLPSPISCGMFWVASKPWKVIE